MELERLKAIADEKYGTLLELYKTTIEVYKFYWDVCMKLNFFFYTGTGIVYSFWVQHPKLITLLYLPMIISALFGSLCYCGLILASSFDPWFCGYMKRLLKPFWDYENAHDQRLEEQGLEPDFSNDRDLNYFYWPDAMPFQIFLGISALGSFIVCAYTIYSVFNLKIMLAVAVIMAILLSGLTPRLKSVLLSSKSDYKSIEN